VTRKRKDGKRKTTTRKRQASKPKQDYTTAEIWRGSVLSPKESPGTLVGNARVGTPW
jgi:hypothetical protein